MPKSERLMVHSNREPNTPAGFFPQLLPLKKGEEAVDDSLFVHGPLSPQHLEKVKSPSLLRSLGKSMRLEMDHIVHMHEMVDSIIKWVSKKKSR